MPRSSLWLAALVGVVALPGCTSDPLFSIETSTVNADPVPVPVPPSDEPDETPPPDEPPPPLPVFCADGNTGASWRQTLPPLPAAVDPGAALGGGSANAEATCNGDAVVISSVDATGFIETSQTHVGGRWYFEATVEVFESGWSSVGVFAPPADLFSMDAYFMDEISAAGTGFDGLSTVSIAVDLDAGAAFVFVDGERTDSNSISLLPGVGAFRAGGVSMSGNRIRFNFGSAPFAFAVPDGYQAWSSGTANSFGNCVSDDVPAPSAPITVLCDGFDECPGSTFEASTSAEVQLVVLGVYDAGSIGSWHWDIDDQGNVTQVQDGPGANGSVLVQVSRPGRIALVLSAYEPTDWLLDVTGPDTQIESVSVYGMHQQTLDGVPDGVGVDIHTICTGGDGGSCSGSTGESFPIAPHHWPFDTGGGDTQGFVREIEERVCLPLKLFAGSYQAGGFIVE